MNATPDKKIIRLNAVNSLFLFIPLFFAVLSLLGWAAELSLFTRFDLDMPPMAVNTALSIIVCVLSLGFNKAHLAPIAKAGLVSLPLLLIVIEGTTLLSYWWDVRWHWLSWPATLFSAHANPPLSSPQTCVALIFLLLASVILLLPRTQPEYQRWLFCVQTLAILAFSTGLVVLLGYLLHDPRYFSLKPGTGVAVNTLISILMISVVIFFRDVNNGLARSIFSSGVGSQILKYFLPVSLLGSALVVVLNVAQYPGNLHLLPVFASVFLIGGLVIFVFMLAERLNWEEKIKKEARKNYQTIFEENPDGMLLVDKSGIILAANHKMEQLVGYSKKSLIGRAFDTLITESIRTSHLLFSQSFEQQDNNVKAKGMNTNIEKKINIHTVHNEIIPVRITINKISDDTESRFILSLRDQRELMALNSQLDELSYIATHDPLTRLPNRYLLEELSIQMFASAERNKQQIAVCFCDLDNFKHVNDDYGHQVGDALLVEISNRLLKAIRKQDVVARIGGDEFIILFSELKAGNDIETRADTVIRETSQPFCYKDLSIQVTISMGICFYPSHGRTLNEILSVADKKLYQAKDAGKNNYKIFDAV